MSLPFKGSPLTAASCQNIELCSTAFTLQCITKVYYSKDVLDDVLCNRYELARKQLLMLLFLHWTEHIFHKATMLQWFIDSLSSWEGYQ